MTWTTSTPDFPRRALGAALLALSMGAACCASAGTAPAPAYWAGTWGSAPAPTPQGDGQETFDNQTVRLIVHTSIGGKRVRVRLSNELGSTPLALGAVHVALRAAGAAIVPGSDRVLTFGGQGGVTLAAGAPALSDPVDLDVPAMADLAVSIHVPGQVKVTTEHHAAQQTGYVSAPGDHAGAAEMASTRKLGSWPFLTEVDVGAAVQDPVLVAFGDSITDGSGITFDSNRRWPDLLMRRLQARDAPRLGIVNRGIGGNRLLRDPAGWPPFGKAGLARFDHDVLATAGVKYVLVLIGINDIGHPGSGAPPGEVVSAQDLIGGYRQLIARAHAKGIAIYGATLTPFEGTVFPGYYSADKDSVRQQVNAWIRSSGEFDAVIDFDQALRDPAHPARVLPAYDSGDHLHPSDAGMQALAAAVPLALLRQAAAPSAKSKAAKKR